MTKAFVLATLFYGTSAMVMTPVRTQYISSSMPLTDCGCMPTTRCYTNTKTICQPVTQACCPAPRPV